MPRPIASLSCREQAVAQRVAAGMTNGEIAQELGVSSLTVKSHVSAVLRKLGVHSRAEVAARIALHPEALLAVADCLAGVIAETERHLAALRQAQREIVAAPREE